MREIKFRAWNKKEERMSNQFTLFELASPLSRKGFTFAIQKDDLEIMQFTSFKDKNGKEIYEGDIIKSETNKNFVVEWDNECGGFIASLYCLGNLDENPEVIGNIFENPELLK